VNRRDPGIKSLANSFNRQIDTMARLQASTARYRGEIVPQKVDVKQLFHLDVFSHIWEDDGLVSVDEEEPWRTDGAVRDGIKFLLEMDRCMEERERLECEVNRLAKWAMDRAMRMESTSRSLGTFFSLLCAQNCAQSSLLDLVDAGMLHAFQTHVAQFRYLLERLHRRLGPFNPDPSFSSSIQVLAAVSAPFHRVIGLNHARMADLEANDGDIPVSDSDADDGHVTEIEEELFALDSDDDALISLF
jgi:hypothetical protein